MPLSLSAEDPSVGVLDGVRRGPAGPLALAAMRDDPDAAACFAFMESTMLSQHSEKTQPPV